MKARFHALANVSTLNKSTTTQKWIKVSYTLITLQTVITQHSYWLSVSELFWTLTQRSGTHRGGGGSPPCARPKQMRVVLSWTQDRQAEQNLCLPHPCRCKLYKRTALSIFQLHPSACDSRQGAWSLRTLPITGGQAYTQRHIHKGLCLCGDQSHKTHISEQRVCQWPAPLSH